MGLIYEVNLCLGVHDGRCPDLRDMDRKGPKDHSGSWISNLELGDLLHDHVACTVIYIYRERERERAGQAGGGSFKTEKTSTPKKEFAYRLCAGRPTSAMPFRLLVAFWWWLVVFPWCVGGGDVKNYLMWRGEVW